jgi:hypothetical protein
MNGLLDYPIRYQEQQFIIRYAVYDHPIQAHVHKWNDDLINRLVNQTLGKVTPSQ